MHPSIAGLSLGHHTHEEQEDPSMQKLRVPMKHNSHYNVNTMLATNILGSRYFRGLYEKTTFQQVIDEIFNKVDNVEPFLTTVGSASNTASTAFCLLYKLFTMKLTKKQMYSMLNNADSPYVRCLGLLYLRYVCPPEKLWDYFKDYVDDDYQFSPAKDKKMVSIGSYAKQLLTEQKYFGTLFPRIPKSIETELQVNLLRSSNQSEPKEELHDEHLDINEYVASRSANFVVGDIVMARYSEDGKWYEAKIVDKPMLTSNAWVCEYIDYGNQEEVLEKHLKLVRTKEEEETRREAEDSMLREKILERKRNEVATSNKHEVAKKVATVKRTISVPIHTKSISKEIHVEKSSSRYKSIDEALRTKGRLGDLEVENHVDQEKRERKRKERQRQLEKIYGNAAKKSKTAVKHR